MARDSLHRPFMPSAGHRPAGVARRWAQAAADDARYTLRLMRRWPGFTAIVTLSLALGIGSATTVFSVVDAVILRPLPFAHGERLVSLWDTNPDKSVPRFGVSLPDFRDWQARTRSFADMALYATGFATLRGRGEPESVASLFVTRSFLDVLGLEPALGRAFGPDDERGEASNTVMLSYGFWRRRFGSDPRVIGTTVAVSGRARTVIGVLPPEAELLGPGLVGAPLDVVSVVEPSIYPRVELHAQHLFGAIGRLKAGVPLAQARTELAQVEAQVAAENPMIAGWTASVFPLAEDFSLGTRQPVLLLLAASGLLLLIACINVASLLLVRGAARARETAARQALGASRGRLVGQFAVESLILALTGGALGVVAGTVAERSVRAMVPFGVIVRAADIGLDARVVAFALGLTVATALGFGLLPAVRASAGDVSDGLREGGRANTGGRRSQRSRRALVVAEVSLAVVLLVCAGLVVQSLRLLLRVDPGFRPEHTMSAQVTLGRDYPDSSPVVFYRTLLADLEGRAGIEAAGATDTPPLTGGGIFTSIRLIGEPPRPPDRPLMSTIRLATPGFFRAMGMRVLAGHDFEWSEAGPSIVVSEAAARAFWPGRAATGRQIAFNVQPTGLPVVGVVNDARQASLATAPAPVVYVSMRRYAPLIRTMTVVVRGRGDDATLAAAIRAAVHDVDPGLPLYNVQPLTAIVDSSTAQTRLDALLLAVFAAAALLLAALGIYGVVSYSVTQRRQEIGVRMALGAAPSSVLRLVLGEGALLAVVGVVLGGLGAAAATSLVQAWLFGIERGDPATYAGVAAGLVVVAILASLVPARRAMRVDPATALRAE